MKSFNYIFISIFFCISCTKFFYTKKGTKELMSNDELIEYKYALIEAHKQKTIGNIKDALILYKKCIEVNPGSDVANYEISSILSENNLFTEAKIFAKRAFEIDNSNIWYKLLLAQLYIQLNELDSAKDLYSKKILPVTENIQYSLNFANLCLRTNDFVEAKKVLINVENNYGICEQVSYLKYQVFINEKKYIEAHDEIQKLININPNELRYYGILAELFSSLNDTCNAEKNYRKIINADPNNILALISYSSHLLNNGKIEKSKEILNGIFYNDSIILDEKIKIAFNILSDTIDFNYFNQIVIENLERLSDNYKSNKIIALLADYYLRIDSTEQALKNVRILYNENPANYNFLEQYLIIANKINDYKSIISITDSAIIRFSNKPLLYLFRGISLYQTADYSKCIQILSHGLNLKIENKYQLLQFYIFLGEAFFKLNDIENGSIYFDKALEISENDINILNNFAYYLAIGETKLDKAEKMSKITIKLYPKNSTYLDTYAWILFKMKKYRIAKKYIEIAFKNGGYKNFECIEHYGDILYCCGDFEAGIKKWELAIKMGSKNLTVKDKIQNLKCE